MTKQKTMPDTRQERDRWHAVGGEQALQRRAQTMIAACAARAIRERGRFHIVLAGGTTPRGIYARLRRMETDWRAWHVYFGDERCLPPTDAERNSLMASAVWLDHVAIPADQVHPIPAEAGALPAAERYAETLRAVGDFDLVLLGLGEDGHTASLFPDHVWGEGPESPDALAVFDAPKPPPQRVSLSANRLCRTRHALFLVTGAAKQAAVARWRAGERLPAAAIKPIAGIDVLVESALLAPLGKPTNQYE